MARVLHCREVVVEVSKAGGMGVFGVAYKTAEQLAAEMKCKVYIIDAALCMAACQGASML